ncbi:MAG: TonB-dependent siderophore receptor [Nitrospira sp.]|nr:TonB-dependent siderophore receptor [Nitrospira sp.]
MSLSSLQSGRSLHVRLHPRLSRPYGAAINRLLGVVLCLTAFTACIGPVKPVPTQQSQEAPPSSTETADARKSPEPDSPEAPQPVAPPVPLPLPSQADAPIPTEGDVPVLEAKPVHVMALRESYKVDRATTATKTDTPIMETPVSVQVVPQQVLKDQQAVRLETALQNVSGVIVQGGANVDTSDSFLIRGFNLDTTYRNGVLGGGSNGVGKREMANVEQVEVLKGPGAILYGRAEPGGIINLVTKQPLATPYYSIQQQVGSYDLYRTTADATGPLTKDDTLLYRVNISYENAGSFRRFIENESVFIAPVLKWNISPRTQITAELEYQHIDRTREPGIPIIGNRPANLGRDVTVVDPVNLRTVGDRYFFGVNWSHRFDANWEVSLRLSSSHVNYGTDKSLFFAPAGPDGSLDRFFFNGPVVDHKYQSMLNLTGHLSTGAAKHTLLVGYDYFYLLEKYSGSNAVPAPPFNIFNPTYATEAPVFDNGTFNDSYSQTWHGLYVQDQIALPYHIHLLAGIRYDYAVGRHNNLDATTYVEDRFSPRGGLLWQPVPWLSLYGSYTEGLGPSSTLYSTDQSRVRPQTSQQWETGVKTEFWDGRLRVTAAYFDLTKQNLAVPDPSNLLRTRPLGEAQTRGIELDITGEILPGWQVIGAYTYLPFAKITQDVGFSGLPGDTGNQGNRLFLAARDFGSVWSTYQFQNEAWRGLKVGGGVVAVGERQGDAANTYQLPGFVTANIMASYRMTVSGRPMIAQLNVNNLLDERYFSGSNGFNSAAFGTPRFVMGSVRMEF